jgi:hypothetical protein
MASSAARVPLLDIRKPLRTKTNIRRIEESFTTEDTKTTKKNLIRKSGIEERDSKREGKTARITAKEGGRE